MCPGMMLVLCWADVHRVPGDQIGRIFAHWVIIYFGHFLENCFFPRLNLCINCDRNGFGYILGVFFTNSSCHPGSIQTRFSKLLFSCLKHKQRFSKYCGNLHMVKWIKTVKIIVFELWLLRITDGRALLRNMPSDLDSFCCYNWLFSFFFLFLWPLANRIWNAKIISTTNLVGHFWRFNPWRM
jgi:hypothetical protein